MFKNAKDVIKHMKKFYNKSFKQIIESTEGHLELKENIKNKGALGQIIELYVFGQKPNSKPEPDLELADGTKLELKVTPAKQNKVKKGLSAKERISINNINYEDFKKDIPFEESSVYKKLNMFIAWYLDPQIKGYGKKNCEIISSLIYEMNEVDYEIIKEDYNTIKNKVRAGLAHELSESDTNILGACTKGAGKGKDLRTQPFSDIKAKQRAFSLKQSYVTSLLDQSLKKNVSNNDFLTTETLSEFIEKRINKHKGKSIQKLCKDLGIKYNPSNKNIRTQIIKKMFGVKKHLKDINEFHKYSICPKTIQIANNNLKESIPLLDFSYEEIVETPFVDSDFSNYIQETKLLLFIFNAENGENIFLGTEWIPLGEQYLDRAKETYNITRSIVNDGCIVRKTENRTNKKGENYKHYITNFPLAKNEVFHVRPHATNGDKTNDSCTLPLPKKDKYSKLTRYTKHAFWVNNSFIKNKLKEKNIIM